MNIGIDGKYYFNERNVVKIINILIYYIVREIDIVNVIVGQKKYIDQTIKRLQGKGLRIDSNVKFITEEDFLRQNCSNGTYILLYSHKLNNYSYVVEKINSNKCIVIGTVRSEVVYKKKEKTNLLEENKWLLNYKHKWGNKKFLEGEEIKNWLIDSINIAKKNVFLECPWLNDRSFETYRKTIINAVDRGIDVRIKYGINCETDVRFNKTEEVITDLDIELGDKENLKLIEGNTHRASAIIDNFYLFSSLNYFSNNMKCDNSPDEGATITLLNTKEELESKYKGFLGE